MKAIPKEEKEIFIKAPWGKIAALTWGSPSNPPVLLCHGKLDSCSGFRPLVSLLPDCFYYVAIDLPGNGRSDHLPRGLRYTVVDLVPTLVKVVDHFQWKTFRYIGHSLGVPIGKFFNIAYPGKMTRSVELDPVPAHHNWPITREGLHNWYHQYYEYYDDDKYAKINGEAETAPKYTYEKALHRVMYTRGLSKEGSAQVLERCLEPAGDGLFRFTFDQRMKEVTILPYSGDILRQIYTTAPTPTLCILAKAMVDLGFYDAVPFVQDPKAWSADYKFKIVVGGHDLHIDYPESIAEDVGRFLMEDLKAKL